jgi:hypothetical protein
MKTMNPPQADGGVRVPSSVPGCLYCGEWDFSPNVECWEMYDELICDDCADQAHEDNSQFGAGA